MGAFFRFIHFNLKTKNNTMYATLFTNTITESISMHIIHFY